MSKFYEFSKDDLLSGDWYNWFQFLSDPSIAKNEIIKVINEIPIEIFEKITEDESDTIGMLIAKIGDFEMFKLLIDKGINLDPFLHIEHYGDEEDDELNKITNVDIINYMIDHGLEVTPKIAYFNKDIKYPRFESGRPLTDLKYKDKNQCTDGYYLPVIRYGDIYYGADKNAMGEFSAFKTLETLGLDDFCGTFYYYEPYSPFYLNLGKTLVTGSKYEAVKHLLLIFGISMSDIKYTEKNIYSEKAIIEDYKKYFGEKWDNVLYISNDQNNEIDFMIKNSIYVGGDFDAKMDGYDQTICMMARNAGYDTVLLQKEPGGQRINTEILDVRSRTISYDSICKFEDRPMVHSVKNKKYPLIWMPSDGFLQFESEVGLDSNDISTLNTYLQNNIPDINEIDTKINTNQTPYNVKNLLIVYKHLLEMDLRDYLNQDYYDRGINNLMVITNRGYLPLLKLKEDQIRPLLNSKSIDDKTPIEYSTGEIFEYLSSL